MVYYGIRERKNLMKSRGFYTNFPCYWSKGLKKLALILLFFALLDGGTSGK